MTADRKSTKTPCPDNVTRFPDPRSLRLRRASELCAALISSYAGDDRELRRLVRGTGAVVRFPTAAPEE